MADFVQVIDGIRNVDFRRGNVFEINISYAYTGFQKIQKHSLNFYAYLTGFVSPTGASIDTLPTTSISDIGEGLIFEIYNPILDILGPNIIFKQGYLKWFDVLGDPNAAVAQDWIDWETPERRLEKTSVIGGALGNTFRIVDGVNFKGRRKNVPKPLPQNPIQFVMIPSTGLSARQTVRRLVYGHGFKNTDECLLDPAVLTLENEFAKGGTVRLSNSSLAFFRLAMPSQNFITGISRFRCEGLVPNFRRTTTPEL